MVVKRKIPRTKDEREVQGWRRAQDDDNFSKIDRLENTNVITGDYEIQTSDHILWVDASAGQITLTLPQVSIASGTNTGQTFKIEKIDSSQNKVIVAGNGSENINGSSTFEILFQYESVEPTASDRSVTGSDWLI